MYALGYHLAYFVTSTMVSVYHRQFDSSYLNFTQLWDVCWNIHIMVFYIRRNGMHARLYIYYLSIKNINGSNATEKGWKYPKHIKEYLANYDSNLGQRRNETKPKIYCKPEYRTCIHQRKRTKKKIIWYEWELLSYQDIESRPASHHSSQKLQFSGRYQMLKRPGIKVP